MEHQSRETVWAEWMKSALMGDEQAYRQFLVSITPYLRAVARRRLGQHGPAAGDAEDIVQDTLLAIHLKRGTWDPARPIGPWISVIVRNKLIDTMRRHRRHAVISIDEMIDILEAEPQADALHGRDIERLLQRLKPMQRAIVKAISIDGVSIRNTAERLSMTEGAVRVALHRALKSLSVLYQRGADDT